MIADVAERNSQSEPVRRKSLNVELGSATSEVNIEESGNTLTSSV